MMSLIVPFIPLASKPRPACLAATAAAHKLPDGRRAQTAHFQLFYYECKVPTNVTDVCPISNSPTTSATKLRMCVGSGGLSVPRVWAEAAAVAVGGGRRAGMPAGRTTQRRRAFDGCSRLWESVLGGYGGGSSGARPVCVRRACAARRRSSRLVGWRAGGGLWRRCERRAWSPPLSVGRRGGSALCGGGREGSGRDDVARAVCGRRARRVHIAERDSASLTIATALA